MNYHNPENLTDWGQSDGWRIRLVGEPLPEDAECFHNGTWILAKNKDLPDWTYRTKKPLPASPLIAQLDDEIKAKQELREVALAVEAGEEWEVKLVNGFQDWHKGDYEFDWYVSGLNGNWQVRLKPKPVTRDWSKPEDVPLNCWIDTKHGNASLIIHVAREGVGCAGRPECVNLTWEDLKNHKHSTDRINWFPCETTEEAK